MPPPATEGSKGIAFEIQQAILNGHYHYGERLPPERELANHFGVSRTTIREALRRLEQEKLLSRRIGSGTFVNYNSVPDVYLMAQRISPIELIETRLGVEPHLVRLAAINATGQDLQRLESALKQVESVRDDIEAFARADKEFHLQLAECSRNPLLTWLHRQINEVRDNTAWRTVKSKVLTPDRIAEYNIQHRALYEALLSRDTEGAVTTMQSHLEEARRDLLGAAAR